MVSLARQLRRSDGLLPGRDTLRAALVLTLVAVQSIEVSSLYGTFVATPLWIAGIATSGALFALAGFALATGANETGPAEFLKRRAVDLGPLTLLSILFAALAVGPASTVLSWRGYFSDPDLWLFAPRVLAFMDAHLPGVFEFNNARLTVIANAWMVPATLLGCAGVALAVRERWRLVALGLGLGVIVLAALIAGLTSGISTVAVSALACFLCGGVAAHLPQRVPSTLMAAALATGMLAVSAYFGNIGWQDNVFFALAVAPPVAFLSVYVAARPLPMAGLARQGWPLLSGLPLYAYPLQQLCIAKGSALQSPLLNLAIALPAAMVLSGITHVLFRRFVARRLVPQLTTGRTQAALPPRQKWQWSKLRQGWPSPATLIGDAQAMVPRVIGFLLFVVVVLALMALMMLAMQRDIDGI